MGIESKYEEPDIDIDFVEINKDLKRAPERRRDRLDVGADAGKDQQSYLRRDEAAEAKAKEAAERRAAKALLDDDGMPMIVPELERREGDEEDGPREISLTEFKRAPVPSQKSADEGEGSNFLLIFGFGSMALLALLIFAAIKVL